MKNLIRGHIYQLKKRSVLFRMPSSRMYSPGIIDPAFFFSGIYGKPRYGGAGAV